MLLTHTADEATLDGEIQRQDSVHVSLLNLNTEQVRNNYFDHRSKILNGHHSHLLPPQFYSRLILASPRFDSERPRERKRDR